MKPTLYFAAPLFTETERQFNANVSEELDHYFDVFLPQRDGFLIPGANIEKSMYPEVMKKVFCSDIAAIDRCAFFLAVLDGRTIDEGVSFELGYAFARGKRCVSLRTDPRQLAEWGNNPMITQAVSEAFSTTDELYKWCYRTVRETNS